MNNNNNNNTKIYTTRFAAKSIAALIFVFALFSASCSSPLSGFNESTAAKLIENNSKYKTPVTITINIGKRLTNAGASTAQLSADDTEEAAIIRAKEGFAVRQPQLLVAENLGFIKLYFENANLRDAGLGEPNYGTNLKIWTFRPRAEITDQGRALWKKLNLPVNEESLPVAVRGTPVITALKDDNERIKSADFTYRWDTTELGAAFDENSQTFKKLTPKIQESLQGEKFDLLGQGNNRLLDLDKPQTARVFFQKTNNEWKLRDFYFM